MVPPSLSAAGRGSVALTFDDGPGDYTPLVLAELRRFDVRATFFVTGANVRARPELADRIVEEGHLLGNHSFSHPQDVEGSQPRGDFDRLPIAVQTDQLDDTTAAIYDAAGVRPRFFRAPGGRHFTAATVALVAARSMIVTHWTADTRDWLAPAALSPGVQADIVHRATVGAVAVTSHPIVLMHDGKASAEPEDAVSAFRGNTVAALAGVLRYYQDAGYLFTDPAGAPL